MLVNVAFFIWSLEWGRLIFSGYPDCRDSFVKSLNVTLNLAMDEQFCIHTPLMWRDKAATWALADELGVLDLIRQRTLTCYNGVVGRWLRTIVLRVSFDKRGCNTICSPKRLITSSL